MLPSMAPVEQLSRGFKKEDSCREAQSTLVEHMLPLWEQLGNKAVMSA